MKVCVVGAGGREHALALALARTVDVVVAPGNPGMATEDGRVTVTPAPPDQIDADLVVIGPEAPLVDGLADRLRAGGRLVFGPGADGARLEGSKAFMKEALAEAGAPTARFGAFTQAAAARAFLRSLPGPYVVKTDGLAAGKGVLVTGSLAEAEEDVDAKLSGASFGDAGRRVVIEEGLAGEECSVIVLCDGERITALAPAQDFKRVGDGDAGPNTGGMGAVSPTPSATGTSVDRVLDEAVAPLVATLRRRGIDYRGALYAGVMLTEDGPRILEFNARFGDPETQVVLPRLRGDLAELLAEAAAGRSRTAPEFAPDAAVCVVMAAVGYPGEVRRGDVITGLHAAGALDGVHVLHTGTARSDAGLVTAGGRVLGVTGLGPTIAEARRRAYAGVEAIHWDGAHWRHDIAARAAVAAEGAGAAAAEGAAAAAEVAAAEAAHA